MRLVHVRLNLEHERREGRRERIYHFVARRARQGRGGHFQEVLKEEFHAEVVQRRAEEYGAEFARANLFQIEVEAGSVEKLHLLGQLFARV